jgi:DNA-binding helix-hairpin-helix protein with protein kinase domain
MEVYRDNGRNRTKILLGTGIGKGGEGSVYEVKGESPLAAKIFHQPTAEHQKKLRLMLSNPCESATKRPPGIAWPQELLFSARNMQCCGYLMIKIDGVHPVLDFYNAKTRRQICPYFNYRYLMRAAACIAHRVSAAHAKRYVIGDINESNILVSDNAFVTFIDCDSWQVRDRATGQILRCAVGKPEFQPPELQGKHLSEVNRTKSHDQFSLAVILFRVLLEGTHPFDGVFSGRGDPPPIGLRIAMGHYAYGTRSIPWVPKPMAPPIKLLPPELRELFRRCFEDGHFNPLARPSPDEWCAAIQLAEKSLIVCSVNKEHQYSRHWNQCPWCDRVRILRGIDPFPSPDIQHATRNCPPRQNCNRSARLPRSIFTGPTPAIPQPIAIQLLRSIFKVSGLTRVSTQSAQKNQTVFVLRATLLWSLLLLLLLVILLRCCGQTPN